MRSCRLLAVELVSATLLLLLSAAPVRSQCRLNAFGIGEAAAVPGNSFRAEIVTTISGENTANSTAPPREPRLVARDAEGRVRIESTMGEFKRDTGPDAGSKVERHEILICDPTNNTMTQIDTLNATANIARPAPGDRPRPMTSPKSFCSRWLYAKSSGESAEDLGEQTIEGVSAHGIRTSTTIGASNNLGSTSRTRVTEEWCSDEIAAIVLRTMEPLASGQKVTVAMRNIERGEPDPSLFRIPPHYAVTESVAGPRARLAPTPPQTPSPNSNSPQ